MIIKLPLKSALACVIHDGLLKLCNTYLLSPGKFTVFQKLSRPWFQELKKQDQAYFTPSLTANY